MARRVITSHAGQRPEIESQKNLPGGCAISALFWVQKKTDALYENCAIILALWLF
jgi:hypothetical protein